MRRRPRNVGVPRTASATRTRRKGTLAKPVRISLAGRWQDLDDEHLRPQRARRRETRAVSRLAVVDPPRRARARVPLRRSATNEVTSIWFLVGSFTRAVMQLGVVFGVVFRETSVKPKRDLGGAEEPEGRDQLAEPTENRRGPKGEVEAGGLKPVPRWVRGWRFSQTPAALPIRGRTGRKCCSGRGALRRTEQPSQNRRPRVGEHVRGARAHQGLARWTRSDGLWTGPTPSATMACR